MSMQQDIIDYLRATTKGRVTIPPSIADGIIAIVNGNGNPPGARAKLHRYNALKGDWEFIRTETTTDTAIAYQVREAIKHAPVDHCYRWDCYNSNGEFEGYIYTVNTSLF